MSHRASATQLLPARASDRVTGCSQVAISRVQAATCLPPALKVFSMTTDRVQRHCCGMTSLKDAKCPPQPVRLLMPASRHVTDFRRANINHVKDVTCTSPATMESCSTRGHVHRVSCGMMLTKDVKSFPPHAYHLRGSSSLRNVGNPVANEHLIWLGSSNGWGGWGGGGVITDACERFNKSRYQRSRRNIVGNTNTIKNA